MCSLSKQVFPCFSKKSDYLVEASAVITHIDNKLTINSNTWHIVVGDFNFECHSVNNDFGLSLFVKIVSDYKLIYFIEWYLYLYA